MKSARQYVKEYFDARPEFGREWPTSQISFIRAEVRMEDALDWIDNALRRAYREAHGGNAVNGVYVDPVDMPTLDGFLTGYLRPQLGRAGADIRRAWQRTCEWCEAHPGAGITPRELWNQAGGPDWGAEATG